MDTGLGSATRPSPYPGLRGYLRTTLLGQRQAQWLQKLGWGIQGRPAHRRGTMGLGLLDLLQGPALGRQWGGQGRAGSAGNTTASWRGGQGMAGGERRGEMPLASQLNSSPTSLSPGGSQEAGEGGEGSILWEVQGRGSGAGEGPHPLSPVQLPICLATASIPYCAGCWGGESGHPSDLTPRVGLR